MTRFPDWPTRLDSFLRESLSKRFAYGSSDCCLFVADAVLSMTGEDIAAEFRSRYHSRKEALDLALSYSGKRSVRALIEKGLSGFPSIPSLCAQRGDILLVKRSRDVSLGILALDGKSILAIAQSGLLRLPLSLSIRAWRV